MNALFRMIGDFFRMFQIFFTISPWEHAVRTRMGKYVKKLGPGVHIKIPLIDVVYKQSVRTRRSFIHTQTLSTKDGATLLCGGSVEYKIVDIEKLYQTLHHAESTIVQSISAWIAALVFASNKADVDPKIISEQATKTIGEKFAQYGLEVTSVDITDFGFIRVYRLVNDQRFSFDAGLSTSNPAVGGGVPAY